MKIRMYEVEDEGQVIHIALSGHPDERAELIVRFWLEPYAGGGMWSLCRWWAEDWPHRSEKIALDCLSHEARQPDMNVTIEVQDPHDLDRWIVLYLAPHGLRYRRKT